MADLVGIAAIIGVIGSPLGVIFAQYNFRRKVREDLDATAKAQAIEAKKHLDILNEQTGTLARVEGNTDGGLTAITAVAKKLGIEKDAALTEVERLNQEMTPTPSGSVTAETPVTLSSTGRAQARQRPEEKP